MTVRDDSTEETAICGNCQFYKLTERILDYHGFCDFPDSKHYQHVITIDHPVCDLAVYREPDYE